ncbi:hypothetical protein CCUG60885_03076 [Mycobacteroides salmoniphilum]|uniref:Uncharacterized protein n=2 Tax=Mycobacteroides salmoniphilum TaxID=404941 RepID=A0A4R8SDG6_9MYCO|nr:hypothetical protein CCUG60885_03076 [Mycobacteroides salmoniphilum]TEA09256.1 hypothetical protein CCUG60883_00017 [Mycobacteroides salmoniphilum]
MQIVSVIDAGPSYVVIWHVDAGAEVLGMSRMCGAWVLNDEPHKLELLTHRKLVITTPSGAKALNATSSHPSGILDLDQTTKNIAAERDRLQCTYDGLPASRKKTLVAPRWPHLPDAIDLGNAPRARSADTTVARALGIARGVDELATAWAGIERQRLARTYLTDEAPSQPQEARNLPFALMSNGAPAETYR